MWLVAAFDAAIHRAVHAVGIAPCDVIVEQRVTAEMAFRSLISIFDPAALGNGTRILPRDGLQPVTNDSCFDQARLAQQSHTPLARSHLNRQDGNCDAMLAHEADNVLTGQYRRWKRCHFLYGQGLGRIFRHAHGLLSF